jgi:hypothetical protein
VFIFTVETNNLDSMRLIETNYLADIGNIEITGCRIYQTTCDDEHFGDIINENVYALEGEFINTSILFVLMDNVNIEDATNFYSSISFRVRQRGNNIIYQVCIVTKENGISMDLLRDFITKVFSNLSLDNSIRIAFASDLLETTFSIRTIENINHCVENMLNKLESKNKERSNQ